jgi:hypothetical protein
MEHFRPVPAREAKQLAGSNHVGAPERSVGENPVDVCCNVIDRVDRLGEVPVEAWAETKFRECEIAADGMNSTVVSWIEAVSREIGVNPSAGIPIGSADQAPDLRVREFEQVA